MKIRYFTPRNIETLEPWRRLPREIRDDLQVVSQVLPFRVNNYVTDQLIDWQRGIDDPIFQLTILQKGLLPEEAFERVRRALRDGWSAERRAALVAEIRRSLNPDVDTNSADIPALEDEPVPGVQHKFRDTCLIFPAHGQTCHAYCTFCFRWPQFVEDAGVRYATDASHRFQRYVRDHPELTDLLFTGGDPMTMNARHLRAYLEPFLAPEFDHIQTLRIGTKSLAYWPYRFVTDSDADAVLRLFDEITGAGKQLAIMAHYNHGRELSTPIAQEALRRVQRTGAIVRTQSPLVRHINDDPAVLAHLWTEQVRLGCVPYALFVERLTGASRHFALPLERAWRIFRDAYEAAPGLARTVRGPLMSTYYGKVLVEGVAEGQGEPVFVLSLVRSRRPEWTRRPFFARYDSAARWLDELRPADGSATFFFQEPDIIQGAGRGLQRAAAGGPG